MAGAAVAGGYGTKYIATGWDIGRADVEQILARAAQFDELAIDGVSMKVDGVQDGAELNSGYVWNDPEWRYETFAKYPPLFRKIVVHKSLRESFLGCGMSARRTERRLASLGGRNPRAALDDDAAWARIAHNYGVLAKIAREGGLRGLLIDNEDYHGTKQFNLLEGDGGWDAATAKMRARGRQVFGAIFREFPDVRLLFFWAFSNARTQALQPDPVAALKESGRLFPAFLNGMLDVMPPEAVFIDGDEDSYTFRAADGAFDRAFVTMLRDAMVYVAPENRAKYRAQVRNSSGLYLDQFVGAKYRRRAGKRGVPNNWYRPPVNGSRAGAFFEDLDAATKAADEYVWVYGERFSMIDWGHDLDGKMQPWNAFSARQTWNEHLGLDTKLRLCKDPGAALSRELSRHVAASDEGNMVLRANCGSSEPTSAHHAIVVEQVTNRNWFAATVERRGEKAPPVARWQQGVNWNWEPWGVRKVEFREQGKTADGWTKYTALLRAPVGATRVQLQFGGEGEVRNAAMYRVDPPPSRPYQLAYQLDISRDKVPTMPTLKRIVDVIASLGYTQFQLYMECAFAYRGYEEAWRNRSPMTPDEMRELSAYCRAKGIDLVPSQNTFAHMAPWFEVPELRRRLAECPDGAVIDTPKIKKRRGPVTLVASGGESLKFVGGLFNQLLPCAESRYVNIGCDEVYDLLDRNCRSAAKVARDGYARTYIDHVLAVRSLAYLRQRESMFWADAIFEHPELIREIPKDMVALVYCYNSDGGREFGRKCAALAADEVRFYVCPGTSGWCGPSGRTRNMLGNVKEAYDAGRRHGAEGMMVCDWGDGGHHQPWIVALPSLVYASALAGGRDITRDEIAAKIDAICGAKVGAALLRYGDAYEGTPDTRFLYRCYAGAQNETAPERTLAGWREAKSLADFSGAPTWVKEDFATMDLLYRIMEGKAKGRALNAGKVEGAYRSLWLKQNREGGLSDSLKYLKGER